MTRRVAIVGLGAVSAAGPGVGGLWNALLAGRSGVVSFPRYDLTGFPSPAAAPVDTPFESYCPPCPWRDALAGDPPQRNGRLLIAAVAEALRDAGWVDGSGRFREAPRGARPQRRGLYAAARTEDDEAHLECGAGETSGNDLPPVYRLAADLGLSGPQLVLHDACTTGTALVGEAFHDLLDGAADVALVAAANADLTLDTLCHYTMLAALSPSGRCRPFDAARDGFVRGEGGAAVVLRAWDDGREPTPDGARAELIGYGASADAHRPTAGHPEQRGLVLAIERCLRDAGIESGTVDHINAHGTGTPMNDLHEALGLARVFGERLGQIPLTANKAVTGHASFASGLLEAVATVRTLETGRVPPIAGHETVDARLPALDLVRHAPRDAPVRYALSLSSAFGGLNAALLLRGIETE